MTPGMRYLILAAAFGAVMCADDITIPLDDGNILISAQFIRVDRYGDYIPELTARLSNQTSAPWQTLRLQFDISGVCDGNPHQWTVPVVTNLGWAKDHQVVKDYTDYVIPLAGKVDGCKTENIKVRLLFAENSNTRIDGVTGERVDLEKQRQELEAKRKAEAAAQAEEERIRDQRQQEEAQQAEQARLKTEAAARKHAADLAAAERKRVADAAAARAAYLAKLPLMNAGSPLAFLGSDRKCAEQFQQALGMDGLEKRKRIADLISYGCGVTVDSPVRVVAGQQDRDFLVVTVADGKFEGKSGWVPVSWLKVTRE